ncbi:Hypothetical predicted protein [Mytilus galloprovincialis]|uniref:Calponin-homology (CH) domain-containing protein n=1 Tax=Mytilus galloprovincialis TaxID=29158 RepID=A0A8B6CXU9_MYTGA|nr:Hypothetical predicted protein [Mytilus galloprovincialis]
MAIPCIIHMINIFLLSVVHVIDHSPCSTDSNSYIFLYLPFQNLDKFDKNLATEILQWIQTTTGESINTSGDMDNFGAVLKNGMLLCKLMNTLAPSPQLQKIINGKVPTLAFKCMEVINQAVMAMESYGVPKTELFQTVDLWEAGNLTAVLTCCSAVGRKVSVITIIVFFLLKTVLQ